jgi:CheY-like chemotaxis protein
MPHKNALIVDDSRTARETLSRMLAAHGLRVETTESAEAALEYLAAHRPDVIFMDHQMPGMDGLQAVKAIKENPATATIPVMMYTSQSGELYVGQARALGAVGVLPKQIKPVEVAEVLESLHLLGVTGAAPARVVDSSPTLPGVEAVHAPADWTELHRWLQEMLADHNRLLRVDLEASIARLLQENLSQNPAPPVAPPPDRRIAFWPAGALILTLTGVAAVFLWLHLTTQARWQETSARNIQLMAALDQQRNAEARQELVPRPAAVTPAAPNRLRESLAAIEWSMNQASAYPPEEQPFGDGRLVSLTELVQRLDELGFIGRVRLESHVGDFCQVRGADGSYTLAKDETPVARCDRVGLSAEEARAAALRQSVPFANFIAGPGATGPVRVELESAGNSRPASPYPTVLEDTTAGQWNAAARLNQRVEVRLLPDAPLP